MPAGNMLMCHELSRSGSVRASKPDSRLVAPPDLLETDSQRVAIGGQIVPDLARKRMELQSTYWHPVPRLG